MDNLNILSDDPSLTSGISPGAKGLLKKFQQNVEMSYKKWKTKYKEIERNEIVVTESIEGTLPKTKIICEKCGHNEASWVIRQTRAADEPSTRIYQCTNKKCKNKWREY